MTSAPDHPPDLKSGPTAVRSPRLCIDLSIDSTRPRAPGVMIMESRHDAFSVLASDGASTPGEAGDKVTGHRSERPADVSPRHVDPVAAPLLALAPRW